MTLNIPDWAPFDAASPAELPDDASGVGKVVALVATSGALEAGWVGDVTASLVRAWSGSGLRLVVADAALERPALHEAFGLGNEEGIADALLWGASIQKVARPLVSEGFYVITAGTPIPDGAEAFASERWRQLCDGFREAGVTLVTLVPEDAGAWESVIEAAADVFVLSKPSEDVSASTQRAAGKLRGVLGVEGEEDREASPEAPEPEVGPAETESPTGADEVDAGWSEDEYTRPLPPPEGPEADSGEADYAPDVPPAARSPRPSPPRPAPAPEPSRRGWLVIVLVVVAAIVAALVFGFGGFGGSEEQGEAGQASAQLQAAPATGVLSAASPPVEESPLMGFSLAVGSYRDGEVAASRARTLGSRVPGVLFSSVPVLVDGTVYYRVLGGPALDSADAVRLAGVVSRETGMDPGAWVQRPTPRAFRVMELDDLEAALGRVDVLVRSGLPAYVLAVDFSDGTTRYRVYVGAFADEPEASHLLGLLRERGLTTTTLSDRIGRLPE